MIYLKSINKTFVGYNTYTLIEHKFNSFDNLRVYETIIGFGKLIVLK